MTTAIETLDAITDGHITLEAETEQAARHAAFLGNIFSAGTGTNFGGAPIVEIELAPDVVPERFALIAAGIGDLTVR